MKVTLTYLHHKRTIEVYTPEELYRVLTEEADKIYRSLSTPAPDELRK